MNQGRKGYTTLEVIAVAAVLIAVAALSIPMIKPMLMDHQKDAAADVVRARWAELRSKAIKNQRPYSFEVMQGTGKFRCVAETTTDDSDLESEAALQYPELPGEIKFSKVDGASDGGWVKIVTFMPDGSAKIPGKDAGSTVSLDFGNGIHSTTLQVHCATGVVSQTEDAKK
jgi:hypothetical protein